MAKVSEMYVRHRGTALLLYYVLSFLCFNRSCWVWLMPSYGPPCIVRSWMPGGGGGATFSRRMSTDSVLRGLVSTNFQEHFVQHNSSFMRLNKGPFNCITFFLEIGHPTSCNSNNVGLHILVRLIGKPPPPPPPPHPPTIALRNT